MYNIYVEEKRKKQIKDLEKKRNDFMKYREKFHSKFISYMLANNLKNRTNSNYVQKLRKPCERIHQRNDKSLESNNNNRLIRKS